MKMIKVRMKIGTHSATYVQVYKKDFPIQVHKRITIKERYGGCWQKETVIVDLIKIVSGEPLYFAARF